MGADGIRYGLEGILKKNTVFIRTDVALIIWEEFAPRESKLLGDESIIVNIHRLIYT
jgi:hypothetical protein